MPEAQIVPFKPRSRTQKIVADGVEDNYTFFAAAIAYAAERGLTTLAVYGAQMSDPEFHQNHLYRANDGYARKGSSVINFRIAVDVATGMVVVTGDAGPFDFS